MNYKTNLSQYIDAIYAIPLLSSSEEKKLTLEYKNGSNEAKDKLILANLRLVVSIAKHYYENTTFSLLDLIQEGNLGLITAIEKYDPSRGNKLSTCATYYIKKYISKYITEYGRGVRIPANVVDLSRKIDKVVKEYEDSYGDKPTQEYICNAVSISSKRLNNVITYTAPLSSLDKSLGEDEDTLGDLIQSNDMWDLKDLNRKMNREVLFDALNKLEPKEKDILIWHYGLIDGKEKTLEEIGKKIGLTHERVRQIEVKAIKKLREPEQRRILEDIF